MILADRVDLLQRSLNGLVNTDDSKISDRALEAEIPKWRQRALFYAWNGSRSTPVFPSGLAGNRFLNPRNYLPNTLTYDAIIQDSGADYIKFIGEPPVNLAEDANGCVFCGDKLTGQTFIPLKTPNTFSVLKNTDAYDPTKVYYNITGTVFKVWGNTQLRNIDLDYLPLDPVNVPTFDVETDYYPISEDVWDIMKAIAVYELTPASLRPADYTNDAAQSQERRA